MSDSGSKPEKKDEEKQEHKCDAIVEKFDFITVENKVDVIHVEPPADSEKKEPKAKSGDKAKMNSSEPASDSKGAETSVAPVENKGVEPVPTTGVATKPDDEKKKDDETTNPTSETKGYHYGAHSIIPTDVVRVDPQLAGSVMGQNIITKIASAASTISRRVVWETVDHIVQYADTLTWEKQAGSPFCWYAFSDLKWAVGPCEHTEMTEVEWSMPEIKSEYKMEDYTNYTGTTGIPNLSQFSNAIRATSGMSKRCTEELGNKLSPNPYITDKSGLFAMGYYLAAHLDYMEKLGIDRVYPAIPEGLLITANIRDHDHFERPVAAINKAINAQAVSFRRRQMSKKDVNVLQLLALGGSTAVTQQAGGVLTPVTSFVKWPKVDFLLWDDREVDVPAAIDAVTGDDVRSALRCFAVALKAYDDMAVGYIRCSAILVCDVITWETPVIDPVDVLDGLPKSLLTLLETIGSEYDDSFKAIVTATLSNLKSKRAADALVNGVAAVNTPSATEVLIAAKIKAGVLKPLTEKLSMTSSSKSDPPQEAPPAVFRTPSKKSSSAAESEAPAKVYRRCLIHAMLEIGTIRVPAIRGANPMWEMMGCAQPRGTSDPMTEEDGRSLFSMHKQLHMHTLHLIGGLLHVSAAVVMHSVNVTGRELRLWAIAADCRSTAFLRQLLIAEQNGDTAPYFQLVVGTLQQLCNYTISPRFTDSMDSFSGNVYDMPEVASKGTYWEAAFPHRIPYFIEPVSLTWAYKGWCDYWGIFGPDLTVDFGHDLVVGGPDGEQYFGFHRDEPAYLKAAVGDAGFNYIAYGNLTINAMVMMARPAHHWLITIRLAKTTQEGTAELSRRIFGQFQPVYHPITGLLIVGTLLTWSWELDAVVVPSLELGSVPARDFHYLVGIRAGQVHQVGWRVDGTKDKSLKPIGTNTFLSGIKGLKIRGEKPTSRDAAGN
ncbi:MAG: putative capsid protein [Ilomantsi totivirus 1]|nr:MAG: putative capsid protein [Ilomantsi totivirus 1]